jgi:3-oxoacyl-[acyl-carrier-protein] synthase II
MHRRVAITGVGVVTPLGTGGSAYASALFGGATGIAPIDRFDAGRFSSRLAAQIRGFTPRDFISPATLRRMDLLSQMATASAVMALADAGLQVEAADRDRIGVIAGTCFGGTDVAAQFGRALFTEGPRRANPILVPNTVMNAPAGHAAVELGLRGVNATVNHREASAEVALAYAAETIARGRADAILAGGGDVLSEFCFEVLSHFKAMSPQDGEAEAARPFDARRNGPVIGEGFGLVCLEDLEKARSRGARIYAEIRGWGMSSAPAPHNDWPADPAGPVLAIERALGAAGIDAGVIDAVCASANGGRRLDALEAGALSRVFPQGRQRPLITSLKGALGESFASGGMRAAAMALALNEGRLPPTVGLETPMADLNFVRTPLNAPLGHVLVNGFASGGTFATLVLSRPDADEDQPAKPTYRRRMRS